MANPFSEAISGVRTKLTKAIDVSDLLLGDLLDKGVITSDQHDQMLVRCFAVSVCCLLLDHIVSMHHISLRLVISLLPREDVQI